MSQPIKVSLKNLRLLWGVFVLASLALVIVVYASLTTNQIFSFAYEQLFLGISLILQVTSYLVKRSKFALNLKNISDRSNESLVLLAYYQPFILGMTLSIVAVFLGYFTARFSLVPSKILPFAVVAGLNMLLMFPIRERIITEAVILGRD